MKKIKRVKFVLKSICPIKMDKFLCEDQPKTDKQYQEQAKRKVYTNTKGAIVIPAESIKACLREASSELANSKKKFSGKAMRQNVRALLSIEDDVVIAKKIDGVDKSIVTRGMGDKVTRVPSYRPFIKEWTGTGVLNFVDDGNLNVGFLLQCLELAGIKYGLLSHRPEFGRFLVTSFKEIN